MGFVLARSKNKMTWGGGGGVGVGPSKPPPPPPTRFGPSLKAYFLVHVRSLHLSTIPSGLFFDPDCFFDYTRLCVTSA